MHYKLKNEYLKIYGFTFGQISFASFVIAVTSGVILAIPYDITKPYESLTLLVIANNAANFFRGIHYWSAQIFLIAFIFHVVDHFRLSTEKNVTNGVWFRLTSSVFITLFIMLSGFILKGDAESVQARRIFESLFQNIPYFGKTIAYGLLGTGNSFQILYVHHIATATIFLWIFIVEHAKSYWPRLSIIIYLLLPLILLTILFPPRLHDNLSSAVKGPWFFLGLQEIFHWLSYPSIVLIGLAVIFIVIYFLPKFKPKYSAVIKKLLLVLLLIYAVLIIIGYFFRGENWKLTLPWRNSYFADSKFDPLGNVRAAFSSNEKSLDAPVILGRHEGCMVCHSGIKGFSKSHDPSAIGCYSCHRGNPFSIDKTSAHTGMILIPGNLNNAKETCGSEQCHPQIIPRINNSIMTSMNGVASVDKWVFGEAESPTFKTDIESIGFSPAETHLRNLCASCHLGNEKKEWGEINESSRGGGCNACHLNYSKDALNELNKYLSVKQNGKSGVWERFSFHPAIDLNVSNNYCFGCHSRSGRISLSYDGWNETIMQLSAVKDKKKIRTLQDGRIVTQVQKDIHAEKGMVCIDCHNSYEVMGDGNYYLHKEDQIKIQCIDCHTANPKTVVYSKFESEPKKIADLLGMNNPKKIFLAINIDNIPIINSSYENGRLYLIKKNSREKLEIRLPAKICTTGGAHSNLSCNSCHNSWTPQCIGCHTEYNKNEKMFDLLDNKERKGEWIEHQKEILAEPASLGVREEKNKNGTIKKIVTEFMPGMILTLDRDKGNGKGKKEFKRLFAPSFSHTIRKESRSCESCHNNPLALGYGRGKLDYKIEGGNGRWIFTPLYPATKYDGLPEDAWIGFLKERSYPSTTRDNTRPFSLEEQKRILIVGACLTCHKPNSHVMKNSLQNFSSVIKKISSKCILPVWN